jgi:peroxiredoxin
LSRRKRWIGYALAAFVAFFAFLGAIGLRIAPPSPTASGQDINLGAVPAPDFQLTNAQGQPVSLRQFRGKAVALAFYDPRCSGVCPPVPAIFRDVQRELGPRASQKVAWLLVNTNPLPGPTPTSASLPGQFLSGPLPLLYSVWQAYHIDVAVEGGRVAYTAAIYLIDGQGLERYLFPVSSEASAGERAAAISRQLSALLGTANQ